MSTPLQCKDIPDRPILEFLARLERQEIVSSYEQFGEIVNWRSPVGGLWDGTAHSVQHAMPPEVFGKEKLARAKMAKLIKRGLVSGCTCGCRGDFELTQTGRLELLAHAEPKPPR